jgi:hypothetical protein
MKKNLFLFLGGVLLAIFLLQFLNAASTDNVTLITPANNTNYSVTISVNCTSNIHNSLFAIIWYNSSGTASKLNANSTGGWNISNKTFSSTNKLWKNFTNLSVLISGLADASNYSFWCQVFNSTSQRNSTNIHPLGKSNNSNIAIDNTAPLVNIKSFTHDLNSSNKAYNISTKLSLNVRVTDVTTDPCPKYARCIFDINGTNETVAIVGGWCNTTSLNLTGLTDGIRRIKIWVNDSAGNFKLNNTYYIEIDSTNPSANPSCSDVYEGNAFPCSCSGTDATSGINTSKTGRNSNSQDELSTPTLTGAFTYTCTVYDYAGNVNSNTCSYLVKGVSSNTPSGSSSSTKSWSTIIAISNNQFKQGYTKKIASMQRIRFEVEEKEHHFGVKSISGNSVTIEISSTPQEANIVIGDTRKFDVSGDNYYDLSVTLNGIENGKADFTIFSIYEEITPETEEEEMEKETKATEPGEIEEEKNLMWLWILLIVIVLAAVIGSVIVLRNNKRKK